VAGCPPPRPGRALICALLTNFYSTPLPVWVEAQANVYSPVTLLRLKMEARFTHLRMSHSILQAYTCSSSKHVPPISHALERRTFASNPVPKGCRILTVTTGNGQGKDEVRSFEVFLNGKSVVSSDHSPNAQATVAVQTSNKIKVILTGEPSSKVFVLIRANQNNPLTLSQNPNYVPKPQTNGRTDGAGFPSCPSGPLTRTAAAGVY
jgi:hypothetical protein